MGTDEEKENLIRLSDKQIINSFTRICVAFGTVKDKDTKALVLKKQELIKKIILSRFESLRGELRLHPFRYVGYKGGAS